MALGLSNIAGLSDSELKAAIPKTEQDIQEAEEKLKDPIFKVDRKDGNNQYFADMITGAEKGYKLTDLSNLVSSYTTEMQSLSGDELIAAQEVLSEISKLDGLVDKRTADEKDLNPLTKMYDVEEFTVTNQGMCGMGMGMGGFSGKTISLTGAEMISLMNALNNAQAAGGGSVQEIQEALAADGVNAVVEKDPETGKDVIMITRPDGQKTKVFDANGNGALDCGDYNFSKALEAFSANMDKYTQTVNEDNDKIAAQKGVIEGCKDKVSGFEKLSNMVEGMLTDVQSDIDITKAMTEGLTKIKPMVPGEITVQKENRETYNVIGKLKELLAALKAELAKRGLTADGPTDPNDPNDPIEPPVTPPVVVPGQIIIGDDILGSVV